MVPFAPFDFYIKRKLYIHNMGHATCAYLGQLLGLEYISQAIDVPEIRLIVQNAMLESAVALAQTYQVPLDGIVCHIEDLLYRFANKALKDTCARVGGDPARKLSAPDRLIGSSLLVQKTGAVPAYIAIGAAAGLLRLVKESGENPDPKQLLCATAELDAKDALVSLIMDAYALLTSGADVGTLFRAAEEKKAAFRNNIV